MRLVLFEGFSYLKNERDRGGNDFLCFSTEIINHSLCPGALGREKDEDKKKLISEIMTEVVGLVGFLRLEIKFVKDTGTIEVSLHPNDPSKNILKSLERRFHDKVRISASLINPSNHWGKIFWMQEMLIDPVTFACAGWQLIPLSIRRAFGGKDYYFELVADFPFSVPNEPTPIPYAQKVLEDEAFSDIIITARKGAKVKAHKSFLSVCSPVFEAMFRSDMEESQTGQVDMTDMSEEGVRAFLRYIYHDDLRGVRGNFQLAFELLCASHKYAVSRLETEMKRILLETKHEDFDVAVAFKTYMFVRNIESAVELKTKALQVLKRKWDELELVKEYNNFFKNPSNFQVAREVFRDLAKLALAE